MLTLLREVGALLVPARGSGVPWLAAPHYPALSRQRLDKFTHRLLRGLEEVRADQVGKGPRAARARTRAGSAATSVGLSSLASAKISFASA